MKTILIATLLLTACFGLELKVGAQLNLDKAYSLACSGAQGAITYQASNLPQGVRLYNDKIELFDNKQASSGYYPVTIRAEDSAGSVDERIVVLVIKGSGSVAINTGSFFGSQESVRTISISSSSTSGNIRSGAASSGSVSGSSSGATVAPTPAPAPAPLPQPDAGVSSLLDSLQVPTSYAAGGAPGSSAGGSVDSNGNFPTINFPTGGDPNSAPNFTPT